MVDTLLVIPVLKLSADLQMGVFLFSFQFSLSLKLYSECAYDFSINQPGLMERT